MSNPLYKSRQQKFIGGNPLYNFGGWVPQIEFGSPIKSYIFHAYGNTGGTPTNDSGFYKGNAYGVSQQTINLLQELFDFAWDGNTFVSVGAKLFDPPSTIAPLITYSYDATTWFTASTPTLTPFGYFGDVYWDGYKFIASKQANSASTGDNRSVFWYSADGITWTGDTTNYDRLTATTSTTGIGPRNIINDTTSAPGLRKNYLANMLNDYKLAISNDYGISWSGETFTDITGGTPNLLWGATGDNGRLLGSRYLPFSASLPSVAEIYYNTIPAVSYGWVRTDAHLSLSDAYSVRGFYVDGTDYYALCNSSTGLTSTTRILKSSYPNLNNWNTHYSLTGAYFQLTKIAEEFYLLGSQKILRGSFDIGFQQIPFDTSLLINSYILPIGDNNT